MAKPTIDDYRTQALKYNKWIEELQAEISRLRDVVEAAGAKFHELDLPVYADLCLNSLAPPRKEQD